MRRIVSSIVMLAAVVDAAWAGSASDGAASICMTGIVARSESFRDDDGVIMTRVWVRRAGGVTGAEIETLQAGGELGSERSAYGGYERLAAGDRGVFSLVRDQGIIRLRAFSRTPDARSAAHAPAPSGSLLAGTNGVPARFIASDRGEGIPYYVDASVLPPGISTAQAMAALSRALSAWRTNSSLAFAGMGFEVFGKGADAVSSHPGAICIQLGDPYNRVAAYMGDALGVGGRIESHSEDYPAGGEGARVGAREFYPTLRGYVVLSHTSSFMTNATTYEEVLAHELGHALGLGHSSNAPALMWPTIHADGRGASLGTDDVATVRSVYPTNTPPYGYGRVMRIVVSDPQPAIPGVNEVMLWGADLQSTQLSVQVTAITSNAGFFVVSSNRVRYTSEWWSDSDLIEDPLSGAYYDRVHVRWSDGVNLSPPAEVRVVGYYGDTNSASGPTGSDGLPNSWMTAFFGHTDPRSGDGSRAGDDPDRDGFSNLAEYLMGSHPLDRLSNLRITGSTSTSLAWQAQVLDLYAMEATPVLTGRFLRCANPLSPTSVLGRALFPTNVAGFLRITRIP